MKLVWQLSRKILTCVLSDHFKPFSFHPSDLSVLHAAIWFRLTQIFPLFILVLLRLSSDSHISGGSLSYEGIGIISLSAEKKAKQKSVRHGYNFYEHLTVQYFVQSRWIWRGASLCLLDWLVQFRIYRKWTFTSFQLVFLRFGNIIS